MNAKNSIGQTSTPTGALPGSTMLCDDEVAVVVSLGMDAAVKNSVISSLLLTKICDFRLSMKELDKHERSLLLMGKLQSLLKDPSYPCSII